MSLLPRLRDEILAGKRIYMKFGRAGMALSSMRTPFCSLEFPYYFSFVRAGIFELTGTTDKVRLPYRSKKKLKRARAARG